MLLKLNQKMQMENLGASTIRAYYYHVEKWLRYYSNNQTQENIEKHLFYLKQFNKSPSYMAVARAALIYYFKNVLNKPITIDIKSPKRNKTLPRPEPRQVIISLIQNTINFKHRTLIELIYDSGLRNGEATRLEWNDVDLVNGQAWIKQAKGKKDRLVKLGATVVQHLLDWKDQSKGKKYVFWSEERPEYHISSRTVQQILKQASSRANLQYYVKPHQLRHSFATHSLEEGTDIRVIQELLGHSSPKTTMIYTRVTDRTLLNSKSPLDCLNKVRESTKGEEKAQ